MSGTVHRPSTGGRLDPAGFAERLLAVIDEGRRTSTYKLAVLIALTDVCAEAGYRPNGARLSVSTRRVAESVAGLYWRQLRPFPAFGGPIDLRQITNKSAVILAELDKLHDLVPSASSWEAAQRGVPDVAAGVLDKVELTIARYPLLRLQVVDGVPQPFMYDVEWTEGVSLRHLHNAGAAAVQFQEGAPDNLVRLAPLIRPLVETHWVRMVAGLNGITPAEDDLRRHLFGTDRSRFPIALRRGLGPLQSNKCFYCDDPFETDRSAVDHFIPWARWPNDAVENLVVAHPSCNGHKSDRIPGPVPLTRWTERNQTHGLELRQLAVATKWDSSGHRTWSVATSLYGHLPSGTPLWNGPGEVVNAATNQLLELLGGGSVS